MNDNKQVEKLKDRINEIQEKNEIEIQKKHERDKKYYLEQKEIEGKTLEKEKQRKKLQEKEALIEKEFSEKLFMDVSQSKKIIGFLKRYVLIGIITGVPGISIAYLWDKWDENKMVKELYKRNIQAVTNQQNVELEKKYELLRRRFNRTYNIDKIRNVLMASDEFERLKNDNKELNKLNKEIKEYREKYNKNLYDYLENKMIEEEQGKTEIIEESEELEIRRKKF